MNVSSVFVLLLLKNLFLVKGQSLSFRFLFSQKSSDVLILIVYCTENLINLKYVNIFLIF